jgi:hypothetical protein
VCTSLTHIFRNVEPEQLAGAPAIEIVKAFAPVADKFQGTTLI